MRKKSTLCEASGESGEVIYIHRQIQCEIKNVAVKSGECGEVL